MECAKTAPMALTRQDIQLPLFQPAQESLLDQSWPDTLKGKVLSFRLASPLSDWQPIGSQLATKCQRVVQCMQPCKIDVPLCKAMCLEPSKVMEVVGGLGRIIIGCYDGFLKTLSKIKSLILVKDPANHTLNT